MKTLVISAIIAMTSLVNVVSAAAVNRTDNFAYNTETNDGRVETQTVFKVENQKFLHRHLKYNYIYDNSGRISQKEVLKWNESTQSFEKHHSLNFFYTDDCMLVNVKPRVLRRSFSNASTSFSKAGRLLMSESVS